MDFSLAEITQATGGQLEYALMPPRDREQTPIEGISIDSRRLNPGDLFWAIAGEDRHGDEFVGDAFDRGAIGAVTESAWTTPMAGTFALRVDNTRQALWRLAEWNRQRCSARVVAVTGSVGKTTTREMIHTALAARLDGVASTGNYNNDLGLPLSLARVEPQHDYAVLELGANRTGEIGPLTRLCRPDVGVITSIADAHLGGFGSVEGIAQAKWELAESLPPQSLLALNGDDARLRRLAKNYRGETIWYGRGGDCDVTAERVRYRNGRLEFRVESQHYTLPVWGRHHLGSALAAIAVGTAFGITAPELAAALAKFRPVRGRCSVTRAGGVTIIDDSYNASPTGMRAALELLQESACDGRKIVVCGDMGELGEKSESMHYRLGEWIAEDSPKLLFACGEFAANVSAGSIAAGMNPDRVVAANEPQQLLEALHDAIRPGDMVLVKGCRAMELEQIVDALATPRTLQAAV